MLPACLLPPALLAPGELLDVLLPSSWMCFCSARNRAGPGGPLASHPRMVLSPVCWASQCCEAGELRPLPQTCPGKRRRGGFRICLKLSGRRAQE